MTVNRNPGVPPLKAAEIMLLDPSTVTRPVEKLQSKGLVTRKTQGRTSPDLLPQRIHIASKDHPSRHQMGLGIDRRNHANAYWEIVASKFQHLALVAWA